MPEELCIKKVVDIAKDTLVSIGSHSPQFIGVGKDGAVMSSLIFSGDRERDIAIEAVRALVKLHDIRRYWIIIEAWKSEVKYGEKIYRRASQDIDRKECLMISEFSSDMKNFNVCIPFKKENDNVIFEKETASKEYHSIWNVYLERQGIDERFDKDIKRINDEFIKKLSHDVSEKYKEEFFKTNTIQQRKDILMRLIADGKKAFEEQKKTMLEDVDEEKKEGDKR